jgi:hypothetical protein
MEIAPTFHCFDDALDLIGELVTATPARAHDPALRLVHGILTASAPGGALAAYAHAWVEDGAECWDAGLVDGQRIYYAVDRADYYRERGVIAATRYTVEQAYRENVRSRTYGPWVPAYQALCGPGSRVLGSVHATIDADTRIVGARRDDEPKH